MPTILDAGTTQLSNADVLDWIKRKNAQHEREDAENKASKLPKMERPSNYARSLRQHMSELTANKYPYVGNPGAYANSKARAKALEIFVERCDQEIVYPLEEQYRGKGMKQAQLDATLGKQQEMKGFTDSELLMIMNHAPQVADILSVMIDGAEERFTQEELEKIVQIIQEVFRCGQQLPKLENGTTDG